ncbi:hypothetical protein AB595_17445 [Massilia sp. WF1]|uniref:hypothetical protein n=1 Tax=unclassified Massilia TaxID=2609279 RepID=UPI000649AA59|nr:MULTISPECIES: hypothetical protein [unclassified Massilia]ALK98061.1 hypothetical protein AM586_19580 [Massilia sp. WG5]KLU35534.1 hypothetical protein AB595_17445 [Massilia sp. WF1]
MNIVCIAWGSLLWKPHPLKLASGWHPDGPRLPLEFVRRSDDFPELNLALCEGARRLPTYWAYLATGDLDTARAMLRTREQISPNRPDWIGSVPSVDGAGVDPAIPAWLRRKGIDAAVWTALPPKFAGRSGHAPTALEAVAWLDSLRGDERAAAEGYIRHTPAHLDTPYRRAIEQRLGWRPLREAHITQRV